jgi:hypothetical protein
LLELAEGGRRCHLNYIVVSSTAGVSTRFPRRSQRIATTSPAIVV